MMILLCGMMASGKGEFSDELAARGWLTVNDDSQVISLHGGVYTRYDKRHKGIYKQLEITAVTSCLLTDTNFVIDRPNWKRRTRERFVSLALTFNVPTICVTFPRADALTHAERRFKSDNRGKSFEHWLEAAQRHEALWEEPSMDEGFDNIVPVHVAREMLAAGKL